MQSNEGSGIWSRALNMLRSAGSAVALEAAKAWHVAQDPATPSHVKAVLYGALTYLVLPTDVVPDLLPVVGFSDDVAALGAALYAANTWITEDALAQARKTVSAIFG